MPDNGPGKTPPLVFLDIVSIKNYSRDSKLFLMTIKSEYEYLCTPSAQAPTFEDKVGI